MRGADRSHWICRVMDQISDPSFYDGVILGMAVATLPFIAYLYLTGN